ncbi:glycosyltransferase [Rhodospirillaceae bacterium SYSU D60014]|uniref:glycosyltransferase n=1 Tax=Virgifigura deserti TaxID=2268457 RepID=UPI000E676604
MTGPTVLFVLKGYPRLSETFIAQEIRALERRGLDIRIASLRHPTDRAVHPVHREIRAPVSYLPEYLYQEPLRVLRAWWRQRRRPGYRAAWAAWRRDIARDRTANRVRRFGQALVLADEMPAEAVRLYAHFLHTPASVARYAALLTGLPWSCSAHAKDIWTTPDWEKREKLAAADWVVTCTAAGQAHLAALAPDQRRVALVYHGLDFERFVAPRPTAGRVQRDGGDPADPVILLSVGRAVEKKGYDDLLETLARLPAGLCWRLVHIGGGPLLGSLRRRAAALGLADRIDWLGAQPQEVVLDHYQKADLFVLASRIAADGDRDGLPNVLMEAQSQRLTVVSTRVSAVPELVIDGVTGVLVAPGDTAALAVALAELIADPGRREALGNAGHDRVRRQFDMAGGIDELAARFGTGTNDAAVMGIRPCA